MRLFPSAILTFSTFSLLLHFVTLAKANFSLSNRAPAAALAQASNQDSLNDVLDRLNRLTATESNSRRRDISALNRMPTHVKSKSSGQSLVRNTGPTKFGQRNKSSASLLAQLHKQRTAKLGSLKNKIGPSGQSSQDMAVHDELYLFTDEGKGLYEQLGNFHENVEELDVSLKMADDFQEKKED